MARFCDHVFTASLTGPAGLTRAEAVGAHERLKKLMLNGEVIIIDNVAEYYFAGTHQDLWGNKDFPCSTPPFPNFVMEWRRPSRIASESQGDTRTDHLPKYSLVSCHATLTDHNYVSLQETTAEDRARRAVENAAGKLCPRWVLDMCAFAMNDKDKFYGPIVAQRVVVDKDGGIVEKNTVTWRGAEIEEADKDLVYNLPGSYIFPALLAISFMNCKNVTVAKGAIEDLKHERARIKRGKPPFVRFKVLQIEPLREILRREGGADTVGLQKALHICRGHFKDYTTGSGLFGKIKGRFWWDAKIRGKAEQGVVIKDYELSAPRKRRAG